jgi:hypothetical protein
MDFPIRNPLSTKKTTALGKKKKNRKTLIPVFRVDKSKNKCRKQHHSQNNLP